MTNPKIENPSNKHLYSQQKMILQQLFITAQKITIFKTFNRGLMSQVFLVRATYAGQGPSNLACIVKFAPHYLLKREYDSYQQYVQDKLPYVPHIKQFILGQGGFWGGLCYEYVGSERFKMVSFSDYVQTAFLKQINFVLNKLFQILEPWARNLHTVPDFVYQQTSYEWVLPDNLVVSVKNPPLNVIPVTIQPTIALHPILKKDEWIKIRGGVIKQVDREKRQALIDFSHHDNPFKTIYQVNLHHIPNPTAYQVNEYAPIVTGQIMANCFDLVKQYAQPVLPNTVNLDDDILAFGHHKLPNPLKSLPNILHNIRHVHQGYVHGDLNLENILIEPETHAPTLIDFALTHPDHILHDFLRLETEVMTKLIPPLIKANGADLTILIELYQRLHSQDETPLRGFEKPFAILTKIRRKVSRALFKENDWAEYYQGLIIYLLGALRFGNLDEQSTTPLPKQVAFWGSALIQKLLETPVKPVQIEPPPRLLPRSLNLTQLHTSLANGNWQQADQETTNLLLRLVKRQSDGWLRSGDITTLSCQHLQQIDEAWQQYSNHHFGFRVQWWLWHQVNDENKRFNVQTFQAFAEAIGWCTGDVWLRRYKHYTFARTAPKGHLPTLRMTIFENEISWWQQWQDQWRHFLARIETCFT